MRRRSRSAARLAAVQALYQLEMEKTPMAQLLHEFHAHRLGAVIEDAEYLDAEAAFFDDVVKGAHARGAEIDAIIADLLAAGWSLARLDRPMRATLRAGVYELLARADVPARSVISEYVDVADAFYGAREKGFVNGLLDAAARRLRPAERLKGSRVDRAKETMMTDHKDAPATHPDQMAGQDPAIVDRLRKDPGNPDAQLDRGLDESMDASDPPSATVPGDSGEPMPSSGFDADRDA